MEASQLLDGAPWGGGSQAAWSTVRHALAVGAYPCGEGALASWALLVLDSATAYFLDRVTSRVSLDRVSMTLATPNSYCYPSFKLYKI